MDNTDDIRMLFGDVTIIELLIGSNWYKGTNYNYYGPARYPVPCTLMHVLESQWFDNPTAGLDW